jgi:hypothetical protein
MRALPPQKLSPESKHGASGVQVGLFAANPRAFRLRSGRCGFSAAIPARLVLPKVWVLSLGSDHTLTLSLLKNQRTFFVTLG